MSKKQEKNETLELIRLVDKEYRATVPYMLFNWEIGFFTVYLLLLWIVIFIYYASVSTNIETLPTFLALLISFFALFVSFNKHSKDVREKLLVERNYYMISRNYSQKSKFEKAKIWGSLFYGGSIKQNEQNSLLRAIIKIKAKNPEIELESEYQKNKSLLSEKKLIENLFYS
jgi:hypothetical protein